MKSYKASWFRAKVDFSELARKKWINKCSMTDLMAFTGLARKTIEQHLKRLRDINLEGLELNSAEHKEIMASINNNNNNNK